MKASKQAIGKQASLLPTDACNSLNDVLHGLVDVLIDQAALLILQGLTL